MIIKQTRGFTLIEAMVALIIFMTGMLSIYAMNFVMLHSSEKATSQTEVSQLLRHQMECIMDKRFDSKVVDPVLMTNICTNNAKSCQVGSDKKTVEGSVDDCEAPEYQETAKPKPCPKGKIAIGERCYTIRYIVENQGLDSELAKKITVSVEWIEKAKKRNQSIQTVKQISEPIQRGY